ncbi:MAG: hypothetical protein AVDCRST_MAG35-1760, partial [uncultured Quadrisphaera sp.]
AALTLAPGPRCGRHRRPLRRRAHRSGRHRGAVRLRAGPGGHRAAVGRRRPARAAAPRRAA